MDSHNEVAPEDIVQFAWEDGGVREWEMRLVEHLRENGSDAHGWIGLACLYFEDRCYPNCLWILDRVLPDEHAPLIEAMRAGARRLSSVYTRERWEVTAQSPVDEELRNRWHGGDLWVGRSECVDRLRKEPFNEFLWYELAALYLSAEEVLMSLWTLCTLIVNRRGTALSGAEIREQLQFANMYRSSGVLWSRVAPQLDLGDIDAIGQSPVATRATMVNERLISQLGLRASAEPVSIGDILGGK